MPNDSQTPSGKVRILQTRKFNLTGDVIGKSIYNTATGTIINPDNYADKYHTHTMENVEGLLDALNNLQSNFHNIVLTGNPTAPTPSPDSNNTRIATTAFVQNLLAGFTITTSSITDLNLAAVATSGNYADLFNKPTSLPANGGTADLSNAIKTTITSSTDEYLNVWFSTSNSNVGQMGYDNDFKYNPNKNTLKVAQVIGNALTATSSEKATNDKNGNDITATYFSNVDIDGRKITFIRPDGSTKEIITYDTNTTYDVVSTETNGLMSYNDKIKLDTVERNANFYQLPKANKFTLGGIKVGTGLVVSDDGTLSATKESIEGLGISSSGGSGGSVATSDEAGLMSAEDKVKLDGIEINANKYVLPAGTRTVRGGFTVGSGLMINGDTLSVTKESIEALGFDSDAVAYNLATSNQAGLMSAEDKAKLDSVDVSSYGEITGDIATEQSSGLMSSTDKIKLNELYANILELSVQNSEGRDEDDIAYAGLESVLNQNDVVLVHGTGSEKTLIFPITKIENVEGGIRTVNNQFPDESGNVNTVISNIETETTFSINLENQQPTIIGGDLTVNGSFTINGEIIEITETTYLDTEWRPISLPDNFETNSYYLQITLNNSLYTGILSWIDGGTSSVETSNEILLNAVQQDNDPKLFLRNYCPANGNYVLQIATNTFYEDPINITFKFKKIF